MRETAIRLGLALGSLALVGVALEVGLRLGTRTPWRPTGFIGGSQSPNRPDFRDPTVNASRLAKRPGTFRILAVGDSVTWGSGIHPEDAYPERIGRRLRQFEGDREVEVINWSRSGWNTARQWRSLEGSLDWLAPDLLILGYSLNDPEPDRIVLDRRLSIERRRPRSGPGMLLYEWSRVFGLVYDRLENSRQRKASDEYYAGLYDEDAAARRRQLEALEEWRGAMRRRGIPMALVIFPMFDSQLGSSYSYAHLHARMANLADDLEVPVLDLLPAYEGVDARRLAVEPFTDSHPNELAHRMAADAILEWLLEQRLLPVEPPAKLRRAETLWASRASAQALPALE